MRRCTPARYRALQWFANHERDPLSVLMTEKPSTKMRRLMAREGQVFRVPVGQFNYDRWLLTDDGRAALAAKPARRKCKSPSSCHLPSEGSSPLPRQSRSAR